MFVSRVEAWNDCKEAHEVTIGGSHGEDRAILSPMNLRDFATAFHNLNLISMDLGPISKAEEANSTSSGHSELFELLVHANALDGVAANLSLEQLLAWLSGLSRNHANDTRAEAHDDLVVIIPLEGQSFSEVVMELEEEVFLVLRPKVEKLLAAHNSRDTAQGLVRVLVGGPLHLVDLTTYNERVVDSVTSRVGHGKNLVVGTSDHVAFTIPVTASDLFTVLGDAWNLALILPVEEDDGALV